MRCIRIHLDQPLIAGEEVTLPPGPTRHVRKVLRLGEGDRITLFNGDGHDYPAQLLAGDTQGLRVRLEAAHAVLNESPLRITLAQSLARGEKMDLVVQKATELGVTRIVPLITERSEVRLDAKRAEKRLEHWQAVVRAACEQCARARLPEVLAPLELRAWLSMPDHADALRLALMPGQAAGRLRDQGAHANRQVVLVVGPEGGLGESDIRQLDHAGFTPVTLGPRILRTETAGLAAVAALQALHGDF